MLLAIPAPVAASGGRPASWNGPIQSRPNDCRFIDEPIYRTGGAGKRGLSLGWFFAASLPSERSEKSMAELEDIYSEKVLLLSGTIPRTGRLRDADATASAHSKLCGSRITVDLKMRDGVVTDYAQDVRACLLGQTSASVMGTNIVGSEAGELREIGAQMRRMLKEGGSPPGGRWSDLAILELVRDYKARHASTLLVFDAVEEAIAAVEKKQD